MANITRRGNTYQFRVSDGFDTNGKRIFRSMTYTPQRKEGTKAYEKEIADAARDFEKQVKEGKYLSGDTMTFKIVADQWREEWAKENLSDHGSEYWRLIDKSAFPVFGNMKISKVMPMHVQGIINNMKKNGLSVATIKKTVAAINSVFRYAYRLRIIQENPVARCELPKSKGENQLHYFTAEQVKTFFKALEMPYEGDYKQQTDIAHRKAFYSLAIYGGFRRGEICALTWEDIDFKSSTITINKAVAYRKGGSIIKDPKTEKGKRVVAVPAACMKMLMEWKREELALRFRLGTAWRGAEDFEKTFVFIQHDGALIDVTGMSNHFHKVIERWNRYCDESPDKTEADKLPLIHLHDLRHTNATILIGAGCDVGTVSERLGHSKTSTTMNIYVHALKENDEKAARILDKMIVLDA